ncbi:MAG: hypothetical protein IIV66_04450, partial [Alistipes sp.]|nr:hypothetical protein [Alistipes sp.]
MNRHYFRMISLVVVASLTLLAGVQCWWVTKMYHEQESDFERRVQWETFFQQLLELAELFHIHLFFFIVGYGFAADHVH